MTVDEFSIGKHKVGRGRSFIIAEVAQAHEGSLGTAHAYIDAIAGTGADAVKFQTHIAAEESTLDEKFRVSFSCQDKTRYDYWKRMEFKEDQWDGLLEHSREKGLVFLSSPFSVKAVKMLNEIGVPAWKVGSGEISTPDLLDAIIDTKKPVLLSTGMSSYGEIDKITKKLNQRGVQFALFQCTSCYPVSLEDIGLNVLDEFRKRYKCPVGLSDHSGSVYPCLTAMARNADLVEVHVVIDRRLFGPDVVASIAIDELAMLVRTREAIHVMDQNPVDKDASAADMIDTKSLFSKSVAPTRKLLKGTVLERNMLMLKKPGNGILPNEKESIIGLRLRRNVSPERILQWEDIEL
jgi:N-acetylneuraminate synthase